MGHGQSKSNLAAPEIVTEFTEREMGFLDQIFHEMAIRSPDDTIDKETFMNFFDLPGVLGERLFAVFDTKQTGVIDIEEFVHGYRRFARGTAESKMEMLFELFDLDGKGGVTKNELQTVLLSVVTPPNMAMKEKMQASIVSQTSMTVDAEESHNIEGSPSKDTSRDKADSVGAKQGSASAFAADTSGTPSEDDFGIDTVVSRVKELVDKAFEQCDLDKTNRLDPREFRKWLTENPNIVEGLDELFIQLAWELPTAANPNAAYSMRDAEQGSNRYTTPQLRGSGTLSAPFHLELTETKEVTCEKCNLVIVSRREQVPKSAEEKSERDYIVMAFIHDESRNDELKYCPRCTTELTRKNKVAKVNLKADKSNPALLAVENKHEGMCRVPGGRFGRLRSRYIRLHGKFLYYYKTKDSEFPEQVVFIQGYFAETEVDKSRSASYPHLVKMTPARGSSSRVVFLYMAKRGEADLWLEKLEAAAQTVDIKKHYELGAQLGKGSFAAVYKARERGSNKPVAVKVIQKKVIDGKQKEYIRIEMSVMKLVRHPNVVRLERVFETRSHIYMVMPLYDGGDLYDYMKHNARHGLDEDRAKSVVWRTLTALRYLHGVGIVHRDLKPENLLLKRGNDPTDIVITDFGLSKFAAPHEAMKAACGTLSYVAPEVLRMEGYGKEVDLWSVGVILFLILRAKLPFHDSTKNKIIARILRQKVQMVDPHWAKMSAESKDLIQHLLTKDPRKRITVEEAMAHDWFQSIRSRRNNTALASPSDGTTLLGATADKVRGSTEDADQGEMVIVRSPSEDSDDEAPMNIIRQMSVTRDKYNI